MTDLYAWSPKGFEIIGTLDTIQAVARLTQGTFTSIKNAGSVDFEYEGESEVDWDSQATIRRPDDAGNDRRVFLDETDAEWLEGQLLLVTEEDHDKACDIEDDDERAKFLRERHEARIKEAANAPA